MMKTLPRENHIYDWVVMGDSCAAFGAALHGRRIGGSVLLVSRHTGLLREASWSCLQSASQGTSEDWTSFQKVLTEKNALRDGRVDGACAEVIAAEYGQAVGIDFLFYAAPWAWEERNGRVGRVGFMTKHGLEWVAGRRWIDATGRSELSGMMKPRPKGVDLADRQAAIFFRHPGERVQPELDWKSPVPEVIHASYGPSLWKNETVLRYTYRTGFPVLDLLRFARTHGVEEGAVVSHGSFVPLVLASGKEIPVAGLPENVTQVSAMPADMGGLIDSGSAAVNRLLDRKPGDGLPGLSQHPQASHTISCDVAVVGTGTGGVLAALSAARQKSHVTAFELLPCLGGVGTSGGIHLYYFGVGGGLQQEVDERVAQVMPLFAKRKNVAGFHPMAKAIVQETLLHEAGVTVLREAMLGTVEREGSRIFSSRLATPLGIFSCQASAWVDSTGDGDLACRAGARFSRSARIDGVQSAFSQGSGRFCRRGEELYLRILNFDAGFVDATSSWDLSRARLRGLEHYRSSLFTEEERPTYIAPLVGVRQTRQIQTHVQVTLRDLVVRKKFHDAIGQTACHFDSHAIDFEFESEEAAFWIWGCRNWRVRTAADIPYRALLPSNIENLFLGCRAVGASADAHQSFRMQRDMQRVGEAAGLGASYSARTGCPSTDVPVSWLQQLLPPVAGEVKTENEFGYHVERADLEGLSPPLEELASQTRDGFGVPMYLLLGAGHAAIPALVKLLREPTASWRAAVVLAMLGDKSAEPRLLQAVREREVGFDPDDPRHPKHCQRLAPNWLSALVFLRRCSTQLTLKVLAELAVDKALVHNGRTACALLCARLAARIPRSTENGDVVQAILDSLQASRTPNSVGAPQRTILGPREVSLDPHLWYPEVVEDFRWQLDFAVAKAKLAWGLDASPLIRAHRNDPRLPVRGAFAQLESDAPYASASLATVTGV